MRVAALSIVMLLATLVIASIAFVDKSSAVSLAILEQRFLSTPFMIRLGLMSDCEGFGSGPTPLEYTLGWYGFPETDGDSVLRVADMLLEKQCDSIDGRNSVGLTHLQEAAASYPSEVTEYLVARGADPSLRAEHRLYDGLTAREIALQRLEGCQEILPGKDDAQLATHCSWERGRLERVLVALRRSTNEI